MFKKSFAFTLIFSLLASSSQLGAQGLKDDYQALDDLPPDDVTAAPATPPPTASSAPAAPTPPTTSEGDAAASSSAQTPTPTQASSDEDPLSTLPTDAMTGVVSEAAGSITGLEFKQLADRVRLTLRSDRPVDYGREPRAKRRQLVVELRNVAIAKSLLKRALDTGEFEGPVALVQAFESKAGTLPTVKVLFQLRKYTDPIITRSGSNLYIDFPIVTGNKIYQQRATAETILPETFLSPQDKVTFVGSRISLNVKDADLSDVLALISKSSGRNFVMDGSTGTKVTMSVKDTPWDQVLTIILLNKKLGYQKMGDVYRIAPVDQLRTEIETAAKAEDDKLKLIPLETRLYNFSYAKADEVDANIKNLLSKDRGRTVVDKRTNSIAATDIPEVLDRIEKYIRSIDLQTPMVSIEGRIVEATDTFSREFNLAWSAGPIRGQSGNSRLTNGGLNLGTPPTGVVGSGAAGGGGLTLGNLGDFGAVTATLGVLESQEKTKNIASPKVTVANNESATIYQGLTIMIASPATAEGQTATLQPFNLYTQLGVTPRVSNDGFVTLDVDFSRDTPATSVNGNPSANRKNIKTKLLIENGKTGVIGGVYVQDETSADSGWPLFKNLPVIGFLFKNGWEKSRTTAELLIFLTARVLNADRALMTQVSREDGIEAAVNSGLRNDPAEADNLEGSL